MRPRPVVGKAAVPDAVRRLLDKFDYPDREAPSQLVPILPTLGGGAGTGAYIHLTRNATQSIASGGELLSWDTLGLQGVSGFIETVATTTVTILQAGYYNIAVQLGWSSFEGGGTITILKNGLTVWAPADDPGLWSTTDGQFFEGTAPAIDCQAGDVLSVNVNPDDASAQTLASATLAVYLVDRAVSESLYRELVLSHGPIAYWRLDETSGTNAADSAGHSSGPFDGTYTGGPTLNQTGVMLDGSGSPSVDFNVGPYVAGSDWTDLDFASGAACSFEAWFNADAVPFPSEAAVIISKRASGSGDQNGWHLVITGALAVSFFAGASGGGATVSTAISLNTSYHVVVTNDGTTLRLYLDGIEKDSAAQVNIVASGQALAIARDHDLTAEFDGRIDEVAIYDRALTVAEILEHNRVGRLN